MDGQAFERHVHLEGAFNFRDAGGYKTRDGRSVKTGVLFRSGELHNLTAQDAEWLKRELRLKTVIDLRTPEESASSGLGRVADLGVTRHGIPFTRSLKENEQVLNTLTGMGEFYLELISRRGFGENLFEALNIIAQADSLPLAFHCSVGKDRTGILAAILQAVLGVPDDGIVSDYVLSHEPLTRLAKQALADSTTARRLALLPTFTVEARPEFMRTFLSALTQEYGSMRGYVEAQGGDAALFGQLEDTLL